MRARKNSWLGHFLRSASTNRKILEILAIFSLWRTWFEVFIVYFYQIWDIACVSTVGGAVGSSEYLLDCTCLVNNCMFKVSNITTRLKTWICSSRIRNTHAKVCLKIFIKCLFEIYIDFYNLLPSHLQGWKIKRWRTVLSHSANRILRDIWYLFLRICWDLVVDYKISADILISQIYIEKEATIKLDIVLTSS